MPLGLRTLYVGIVRPHLKCFGLLSDHTELRVFQRLPIEEPRSAVIHVTVTSMTV